MYLICDLINIIICIFVFMHAKSGGRDAKQKQVNSGAGA